MARHPQRDTAAPTSVVRQQRAWVRAVLGAKSNAQPLLRAVPTDRLGRRLVRRPILERVAHPGSRLHRRDDRDRAVDREVDCTASELCRGADAVGQPLPGRRRRPHRAAHRGQRAQPGHRRRPLSRRRVHRPSRGRSHEAGPLLDHGSEPGLERRALLLVVDDAPPPVPRPDRVRPASPGTGPLLSGLVTGCARSRWPSSMSACPSTRISPGPSRPTSPAGRDGRQRTGVRSRWRTRGSSGVRRRTSARRPRFRSGTDRASGRGTATRPGR